MSVGGRLQYNLTIGSFLKFVDGAYDKLKLIQEYEMKSCSIFAITFKFGRYELQGCVGIT